MPAAAGHGYTEGSGKDDNERDGQMNRWTGDSRYARIDWRTFTIATIVAYGVGLWTDVVHWRSGAAEGHGVTFWPHFLRDSTLSVPLVLLAVMAAMTVVGRRAGRGAVIAGAIGTAVASALAIGVPVHTSIFGMRLTLGVVPPVPVAMLGEFFIYLPAALLITLALIALCRNSWPVGRTLSLRLGRFALDGCAVGRRSRHDPDLARNRRRTAQRLPCRRGRRVRTTVTMINVDIPLNRWGDHDPAGNDVRADQSDPGDPGRGTEPRGRWACATTRSSRW